MHKFNIIAGPCSVESYEQMEEVFKNIEEEYIRAGVFKPRTNPESFQGLKEEGIKILEKLKKKYNKKIVCEITSIDQIPLFDSVDIIQIGARNMQNFELLKKVGSLGKPVLLKRGFGNTIDELISSAKYIEASGNNSIILCERGIRTFNQEMRFTLDLSAVLLLKEKTNYKIYVDPSHAAGKSKYVIPLAKAAKAIGADGIIVEVHPYPKKALSDSEQQLTFSQYYQLKEELKNVEN